MDKIFITLKTTEFYIKLGQALILATIISSVLLSKALHNLGPSLLVSSSVISIPCSLLYPGLPLL